MLEPAGAGEREGELRLALGDGELRHHHEGGRHNPRQADLQAHPRRRRLHRHAAIDAGDAIKDINCDATNALAVAHYEAKGPDDPAADALACLKARCGLDAKTVDEAYKEYDEKKPWDEVLS